MIAALFDCDGTILKNQFGRGLLKYASENNLHANRRRYYASILIPFLLSKANLYPAEKLLRSIVTNFAYLFKGLDEQEVDTMIAWNVDNYLLPSERPEIVQRLIAHRNQNHKVIIVSAQLYLSLKKIAENYDIVDVIGTRIQFDRDTSKWLVLPPVITGRDKQLKTQEYIKKQGWEIDWEQSYAYADSYSDLDLLEMVGKPTAVYPDVKLQGHAKEAGWQILEN